MTGYPLRYATHVHRRDVSVTPPDDASSPRLVDAMFDEQWRTPRPDPSPRRAAVHRLLPTVEVTLAILFLVAVLT